MLVMFGECWGDNLKNYIRNFDFKGYRTNILVKLLTSEFNI